MATIFKRKDRTYNSRAKWRARWKNAETGKWQTSIAYLDKQASLALGERLEQESARRSEGLIDPLDKQRKRPISEHLEEFITRLKTGERNGRYVFQVRSRILRVIEELNLLRLYEFDPVNVLKFLSGLRFNGRALSGITRNEYITSLKAFTRWAVEARRIEIDPLATLKRGERKAIKPKHPRRALTLSEIGRLLDATVRRALLETQTIRMGKNKGKAVAKVTQEVWEKKIRLGQERKMCYLLAFWVGLRRNEIKELKWDDVDLDITPPRIRLRAEVTKSRRADVQVIHPQLAEALRKWRDENIDNNQYVVSRVPGMKVLKADLKLAGIEYGNEQIGYADLHAQRMSLSTTMAVHRLSPRVRQAHMRHTDPRLTDNTYMDETLLPVAEELFSIPWIPDMTAKAAGIIHLQKTANGELPETENDASVLAPNMHQTVGSKGQNMARVGKMKDIA